MKLYLRGKYYYFKPCINGKQKWVNTHEENRLKAKIFAEDYLHDKRHSTAKTDGKYNFDNMLWTDFCDKFIAYSKYNKSAPEADIRVIKAINNTLDIKYFKELNADKIRKYISIRKEIDKLKDNSLNRDLHSIKSMWKFATTELFEGIRNEASLVKEIPTEKMTKTKYFTEEEIGKILTNCESERITIACYLMLYLGLRLKEACLLEWKDVLFNSDSVRIYPHKTKRANPNPAIVPMNKNLKIFLKNLSNDSKYVIGADFNNKQALCSFSATISKYFKRIGIEGTAHTCRHTFISHLIMKGVDGSVVQRWARINKPEILQVYLHLSPKYSNEAINLLPY